MFKNVASQSATLYAVDASTGLPKPGDAANMVFYVSKDDGAVAAVAAASGVPTEVDAANDTGSYKIALAQAETNADKLRFSGRSVTANVVVVPVTVYTVPPLFTSSVAQTGDSYARLGTPVGASVSADIATRSTYAGADTAGTATLLSRVPGVVQPQTGDSYARLGTPAGASLAADVATRSVYAGGPVASVTAAVTLPAAPTDWVSAAAVSEAAVAKVQAGLSTYAGGAVASVTDKTGYALAPAGLDAVTVEPGVNARQALSPILAAAGGVITGQATRTPSIKAGNNPSVTRISATTDSSGNRPTSTLNLPA